MSCVSWGVFRGGGYIRGGGAHLASGPYLFLHWSTQQVCHNRRLHKANLLGHIDKVYSEGFLLAFAASAAKPSVQLLLQLCCGAALSVLR
jgi:hypothetical protein